MLPTMSPLPGRTRAEALAARIQLLIKERGLRPGEQIGTKTELGDWARVSKATMNETVRLLESQGHVTVRPGPGGGLFVAEPDPMVRLGQSLLAVECEPTSVADAIVVRELLEPSVIIDAARHRTLTDIAELKTVLQEMAGLTGQPTEYLFATWRLHRRIAGITPNRVLRATYLAMLQFIEDQTRAVGNLDNMEHQIAYKRDRLKIHRDLVNAIASGDQERTAQAIHHHSLGR